MRQQVALFATSTGSNIAAWDLATGSQLCAYKGNASPRNGLCAVGEQYFAAAQLNKGPLHIWAWHKDSPLQRAFPAGQATCLAASACGSYLAAGGASGAVWVWCVASGRLLAAWQPHFKAVTCLAWSDGAAFLVSGGEDTQVHCVLAAELLDGARPADAGPLQPLHTWSGHALAVTAVAVGAGEANAVAVTTSLDRTIKLWNIAGGALLRSVSLPTATECVALPRGEQLCYVGGGDGDVYEVALVPGDEPGGSGGGGGAQYVTLQGGGGGVTALAVTGDGAYVVAGCRDGSARVYEATSRQAVRLLQSAAKGPVTGVLLADRNAYMVAGSLRKGPSRPAPLAQLCKYQGMAGCLAPWQGAMVILDGSSGGGQADMPLLAETAGTVPAVDTASDEVQQLRAENEKLRQQVDEVAAVAAQWQRLHSQLYNVCADELVVGQAPPK